LAASVTFHVRFEPTAELRLFCFPHAGAGASVYHPWSRVLPRSIQVCAAQLPGRENRLRERPFTDIHALVNDLAEEIRRVPPLPFAFFGHSMGAAIAFELAFELRRRGLPTPVHLFASAFRAPHLPATLPPLATEVEPRFLAGVQERYGQIPQEILNEPELVQLIVPVLRADLALIETYTGAATAVTCPITVLAGSNDHTVSEQELRAWCRHTTEDCQIEVIPGGHFFVKDSREQVVAVVERRLRPYLTPKAGRANPASGDA
jgi:surfactin synthase thioesterase subunit